MVDFLVMKVVVLEGLLSLFRGEVVAVAVAVAVAVTDKVLPFALIASAILAGSACFLLPNRDPNSLLFCVFCLWTGGSGVLWAGSGE